MDDNEYYEYEENLLELKQLNGEPLCVIVSDTQATEAGKKVMDKYAKAIKSLGVK